MKCTIQRYQVFVSLPNFFGVSFQQFFVNNFVGNNLHMSKICCTFANYFTGHMGVLESTLWASLLSTCLALALTCQRYQVPMRLPNFYTTFFALNFFSQCLWGLQDEYENKVLLYLELSYISRTFVLFN